MPSASSTSISEPSKAGVADSSAESKGVHSGQAKNPLHDLIPDPSGFEPLCAEPEFAAILEEMAADEAPRMFAVVQEYGDRVDGHIAAWGMAFGGRAEVVSVECGSRMSLRSPENALRAFSVDSRIRARLVWFDPTAPTASEKEAA